MRTFEVIKLACGWSVRIGGAATTPCRSRAAAIAEAERMAEGIRRHGEHVRIIVAENDVEETRISAAAAALRAKRIKAPGLGKRT